MFVSRLGGMCLVHVDHVFYEVLAILFEVFVYRVPERRYMVLVSTSNVTNQQDGLDLEG